MRQRTADVTHPHSNGSNGTFTNGHAHSNGSLTRKTQEPLWASLLWRTVCPLFLMSTTPILVTVLWYTAEHCDGSFQRWYDVTVRPGFFVGLSQMFKIVSPFNGPVVLILAAFMAFQAFLYKVVPGPTVHGPVTSKGNVPVYTDNGFSCYVITMLTLVAVTKLLWHFDLSPTYVYDRFGDIIVTLTLFSLLFCLFLYYKGLTKPSSSDSGTSGNFIFDYYWGTELYPRVAGVDVKVFTNCRFGMTAWPVLCAIFALKNYELYGFVDSMWVSCSLQLIYCTKFFWWEAGYMRTIDIMLDRAGYYICWGCLVYIPGFYASVSLYLVRQQIHLGATLSAVISVIGVAAIIINYHVDWQKKHVRETKGNCTVFGNKPEIITAKYALESGEVRESILLTSGYWGIARHFHYLPELVLAACWTGE